MDPVDRAISDTASALWLLRDDGQPAVWLRDLRAALRRDGHSLRLRRIRRALFALDWTEHRPRGARGEDVGLVPPEGGASGGATQSRASGDSATTPTAAHSANIDPTTLHLTASLSSALSASGNVHDANPEPLPATPRAAEHLEAALRRARGSGFGPPWPAHLPHPVELEDHMAELLAAGQRPARRAEIARALRSLQAQSDALAEQARASGVSFTDEEAQRIHALQEALAETLAALSASHAAQTSPQPTPRGTQPRARAKPSRGAQPPERAEPSRAASKPRSKAAKPCACKHKRTTGADASAPQNSADSTVPEDFRDLHSTAAVASADVRAHPHSTSPEPSAAPDAATDKRLMTLLASSLTSLLPEAA